MFILGIFKYSRNEYSFLQFANLTIGSGTGEGHDDRRQAGFPGDSRSMYSRVQSHAGTPL
jgi:hypothetical protein